MNIREINIQKLKPSEYNPRKDLQPEDEEYIKIRNSINEFGYVAPIIINSDMTVIGGHQRLKVLKELGYNEIQCIVVDLDKNKEKALNLVLNKISGEWDNDKLEKILAELKKTDIDMNITGFNFDEIDNILKDVIGSKEDDFDLEEALNEIKEPITKSRVYVYVNNKNELATVTYFDKSNKRNKIIDLTHYHNKTKPHTHHGYIHNENDSKKGYSNLSTEETKMVENIKKIWYNYNK